MTDALTLEQPEVEDPTKPKPVAKPPVAAGQPALPTEYAPATPAPNRLELAKGAFDTFAKSTAPTYAADLRLATQQAAGKGNIGSGGLRTTYGNLANQRALALDTQRDTLINKATEGMIGDEQEKARLDLAKQVGLGGLDVQKGTLELAKEHEATSSGQQQQQLDLNKKTAEINAAYQAGTLSLAQKDQALRELQNTQNFGIEGQKLQLAKDQLAQTASQFGLSLAQQKELATLADATANRQLDISSAQGKNSLLLELARIMGVKDANIPASFLEAIAKALGIALPTAPPTTSPPPAGLPPTLTPPTNPENTTTGTGFQ